MPTINVVGGLKLIGGSVTMPFINVPPVWTTSAGSLGSVKEFDTVTSGGFFILAVDPDGLPVTPVVYDIIAGALPTGATLDSNTGVITGPVVPVASDTPFTFTARVSDGLDQVSREFSITVLDNIAPVWTTPAGDLGSRHEAETITSGNFTVVATDADSGPGSIEYTVSAGALPTGASLDSSTGDITGPVVVIASDTTYNFTIDASDTDKATSQAFSITVDNNTVPVWQTSNAAPIAEVDTGEAVDVTVEATDADGLPLALTYSVSVGVLPTGLSLNSSSGAITGTATVATTTPFTVEADDGLDVATRQFTIIVNQGVLAITNSLLFNDDDSSFMSRTPSGASNRDTWTFSTWIKRATLDNAGSRVLFTAGAGIGDRTDVQISLDKLEYLHRDNPVNTDDVLSSAVLRDVSAWYHIIFAIDTTQGTEANRVRMYLNGTEITDFTLANYPAQNVDTDFNSAVIHRIGSRADAVANLFDGYMAETIFVDGQQLTPTDFGFFDTSGDWQPLAYAGTFGTNGFHLDFAVAPGTGNGGGTDVSGNGNHFTDSGLVADDQTTDTPGTNTNYCTWNAIYGPRVGTAFALTNGNLSTNINNDNGIHGTFLVDSGKWYWEITIDAGTNPLVGIVHEDAILDGTMFDGNFSIAGLDAYGGIDKARAYAGSTGQKVDASSASAYGNTYTVANVVGVAWDADLGAIWFSKDGTWQNSATVGEIEAGTTTNAAFTGLSGYWSPLFHGVGNDSATANFGQKTFSGTAPTGFLDLNSSNLPTPAIADPGLHMNTIAYNGNGTTGNALTGVGFQPDLVWIKVRSQAGGHRVFDSVRGIENKLATDSNANEVNQSDTLTSFDSDGFTVGAFDTPDGSGFNASGQTYVAWNWKADGTGVANTAGSINSTVSANTTAGFSIISYTGNDTSGATIGHGLGAVPNLMIVKKRDADGSTAAQEWAVYHSANTSAPETERLLLDTTAATVDDIAIWNDTAPSSTLFTVGSDNHVNEIEDYIAYLWAEVEGFSKISSYTGNGSNDGPFVFCGFRPAYILFKRSDSTGGSWRLRDSARDSFNVVNNQIAPNSSGAEQVDSATEAVDFLSNGFKLRTLDTGTNASGGNYIFAAFAESPFKTARAR